MYYVFVDESGSPYSCYRSYEEGFLASLSGDQPGRTQPYPNFVLAAVGFHESHLPVVDEWFENVKTGFLNAGSEVRGKEFEIKGSLFYSLRLDKIPFEWSGKGRQRPWLGKQKNVWGALNSSRLRSLENSLFDLLRRLSPSIWIVVVKQHEIFSKYKERTWPPYYWALTLLQQRVLMFVQRMYGTTTRGTFVLDETSTLRTAAQFDEFLKVREVINSTASWPARFSQYLDGVPLFGQSHLHQALQVADVVAHAAWRRFRGRDPLAWFNRLEPFLAKHWTTGKYDNAGLTVIG